MATPEDKPFDQAVRVHGRRAGQVRNISSAREAAEMAALRVAAEDRYGSGTGRAKEAAAARQAFRAAAEEAGILIGDDRRPVPKPMKRKR